MKNKITNNNRTKDSQLNENLHSTTQYQNIISIFVFLWLVSEEKTLAQYIKYNQEVLRSYLVNCLV